VTKVNEKLVGDPLDINMFNFTGWVLDEPKAAVNGEEIMAYVHPKGVVHRQERERLLTGDQELGEVPAYRSVIV